MSTTRGGASPFTRIMGVDPGSRVVGFACLEARKPMPLTPRDFRIVDAGVLKADLEATHPERLGGIHEMLFGLLVEFKPDVFVIERAFTGVNMSSALKLGEARGALISAARRLSLPVAEITPAQVKRLIAGSGAATKDDVSHAMKVLMGFDRGKLPHDVTDALAIALCHGLTLPMAKMLAECKTSQPSGRRAPRRKG